MDLRKRLGMPSALDQVHAFRDLMVQREQDHRRWLDELEASVREKRPFTLAMDPHQCAFGRWYDSYEAPDPWTKSLLRKFDHPHQRLHGAARQIEALKVHGDTQAMAKLLGRERNTTLAVLLKLFGELQALILETHREVAMVVERRGLDAFAATADEAQSVVSLTADSVQDLPSGMGIADREAVTHVARRPGSQELLMLLEPSCLLAGPGRQDVKGFSDLLLSPPH
jgi:purine-binding chemotaxis protein CheW